MDEAVARAVTAGVLFATVALLGLAARAVASRRRARILAAPADPSLATGRTAILYFHGDHCGDCVAQERELDDLLGAHPEVAIRADHAPSALSARFGVLTVPTTVVLDGAGRPRAVNYGLATRDRLTAQVADVRSLSETA